MPSTPISIHLTLISTPRHPIFLHIVDPASRKGFRTWYPVPCDKYHEGYLAALGEMRYHRLLHLHITNWWEETL